MSIPTTKKSFMQAVRENVLAGTAAFGLVASSAFPAAAGDRDAPAAEAASPEQVVETSTEKSALLEKHLNSAATRAYRASKEDPQTLFIAVNGVYPVFKNGKPTGEYHSEQAIGERYASLFHREGVPKGYAEIITEGSTKPVTVDYCIDGVCYGPFNVAEAAAEIKKTAYTFNQHLGILIARGQFEPSGRD